MISLVPLITALPTRDAEKTGASTGVVGAASILLLPGSAVSVEVAR